MATGDWCGGLYLLLGRGGDPIRWVALVLDSLHWCAPSSSGEILNPSSRCCTQFFRNSRLTVPAMLSIAAKTKQTRPTTTTNPETVRPAHFTPIFSQSPMV